MLFNFLLHLRAHSANAEHISTVYVHDDMSMFDGISKGHRVRSQRNRAPFGTTSITREFKLRFFMAICGGLRNVKVGCS